jgi:hypothetical protein
VHLTPHFGNVHLLRAFFTHPKALGKHYDELKRYKDYEVWDGEGSYSYSLRVRMVLINPRVSFIFS